MRIKTKRPKAGVGYTLHTTKGEIMKYYLSIYVNHAASPIIHRMPFDNLKQAITFVEQRYIDGKKFENKITGDVNKLQVPYEALVKFGGVDRLMLRLSDLPKKYIKSQLDVKFDDLNAIYIESEESANLATAEEQLEGNLRGAIDE